MHLERHQSSVNEFHLITWHGVSVTNKIQT